MPSSWVACLTIKLAFPAPGVTLSIAGQWLDVIGRKQKNREEKIQAFGAYVPGLEGQREISQASKVSGKLVKVTGQEIRASYMLLCPACHWPSLPAFPLAGACQGFLRTCICVDRLGNHAMTSLARVILHHSLAFFPSPDWAPDWCTTAMESVPDTNLQLVGSPSEKGLLRTQQASLWVTSESPATLQTTCMTLAKTFALSEPWFINLRDDSFDMSGVALALSEPHVAPRVPMRILQQFFP